MGPPSSSYTRRVPAVDQAVRVMLCLAQHPGLPLTELCKRVGIHKSKGLAILNTLAAHGLVLRNDSSKTYTLGPGLLPLSRSVLDHSELRAVAGPYLEPLARATGGSAFLGLRAAERVFVVAKAEAPAGIGVTIRVGHGYPLTWGAHGKVLTAFAPPEERSRILELPVLHFHGAQARDEVDRPALEAELDECCRKGFAVDPGRVHPGVSAVAAPVFGAGETPIGCVIVVGTFPPESAEAHGPRVAETAREVSRVLGPTLERVYGAGQRLETRN
ncbi:IclR family transcriptional regulator [Deferrisoma camini]|uniref:IclR family transcriptional regulator n=1 Tax=Deferrisoma camini TaxID=1035120 RepID=UPI00046D6DB6|nr:IclR family transcriptional regulator [Deferrisoma camini]